MPSGGDTLPGETEGTPVNGLLALCQSWTARNVGLVWCWTLDSFAWSRS